MTSKITVLFIERIVEGNLMKTIKTKLLAVLMAVTMVFAMAPLTAGLAFADDENVDATEVEMTAQDADDVEATEPEAVDETAEKASPGVESVGGVTKYNVWVKGKQVTSKYKSGKGWKYSQKDGVGTLTLTKASFSGSYGRAAIYAENIDLIIKLSGKNTIINKSKNSGDSAIKVTPPNFGGENSTHGKLTIKGSGSLNVKGTRSAIDAGKLDIQNVTIKAEATNADTSSGCTINCNSSFEDDDIAIKNANITSTCAIGYAIYGGGIVDIEDSVITAKTQDGPGIQAMYDMRISSSKVTTETGAYGIMAINGKVIVCNEGSKYPAYVETTSTGGSPVIMTPQGIDFDGLKILEPEGGYVYGDYMYRILTADGEQATHVIISKYANTLDVKGKTTTVSYKKLKKKTQTVEPAKVYTITDPGQGDLTFKKSSGNKKIKIGEDGTITVKKGLKKGKFKVKVKVRAAGDDDYNFVTKTVTVTIKVK